MGTDTPSDGPSDGRGDPGDLAGGLPQAVALLEAAADAFLGLDYTTLSGDEMRDGLCRAHTELQRLQAGIAHVADRYKSDGTWRESGLRSPAAELSHRCRAKRDDMNAWFRLGRDLRDLPKVNEALAGGEIHHRHADLLCSIAHNPPLFEDAYHEAEDTLLGWARTMNWPSFTKAIAAWKKAADPDGAEKTAADDHDARYVRLTDGLRGTGLLDGELTPACAEILRNALERIADELWRTDWNEAKERLGRNPETQELSRTIEQRLHDALEEMANRATAMPDGAKRPRPLITVFAGEDSLSKICELDSGTVITEGQVIPLLDDAVIERIVWDGPSRIIDVGEKRLFRGALRRAVQARDRECQFPGCHVPAKWCEIDHVQPWSKDGKTIQANAQLFCKRHNLDKSDSYPDDPDQSPGAA